MGRVKQKRPEKSILLTGLRGVGKTVLLNEMERIALAGAGDKVRRGLAFTVPLFDKFMRRAMPEFDLQPDTG